MATTHLPRPTCIYSPAPTPPTKTSFHFRSVCFGSLSSRTASFACIKCSNNGANATANRNNHMSGLKDLFSGWVHEPLNTDGPSGLVDSLRKAAQRVVHPEDETKKMKQEICQLLTRDAERIVQHETEIKKMREDLNHYKTISAEKLAQQETKIKEMKQELSHHKSKAEEIEECQKRLLYALTLVAEAENSLQSIIQIIENGKVMDCSSSVSASI